jgi:hypothetical protein
MASQRVALCFVCCHIKQRLNVEQASVTRLLGLATQFQVSGLRQQLITMLTANLDVDNSAVSHHSLLDVPHCIAQ